jgi:hypothetical protein
VAENFANSYNSDICLGLKGQKDKLKGNNEWTKADFIIMLSFYTSMPKLSRKSMVVWLGGYGFYSHPAQLIQRS